MKKEYLKPSIEMPEIGILLQIEQGSSPEPGGDADAQRNHLEFEENEDNPEGTSLSFWDD